MTTKPKGQATLRQRTAPSASLRISQPSDHAVEGHFVHVRQGASLVTVAHRPWTDAENDLVVADYFAMLIADLAGHRLQQEGAQSTASEPSPP